MQLDDYCYEMFTFANKLLDFFSLRLLKEKFKSANKLLYVFFKSFK